jgi:hypothetical protein
MDGQKIRWWQVEKCLEKRGHDILPSGKNKVIIARDRSTGRPMDTIVIPKECCDVGGAEVTRPYIELIKRVLHVSAEQIIKEAGGHRRSP